MNSAFNRSSMPVDAANSFAAMLAPVRVAFLKSLPEHICFFEEYRDAEAGAKRDDMEQQLARRAHRIVGVAQTLSYGRLGRLASRLEYALTDGNAEADVPPLVTEVIEEMLFATNS
ncbi:MAG: Hpt domain-containing protein [Vannielia sp.]|uniref:Hpt domain-containing protein n=1 Tax=Rhodobacterales TaxID=204455 RepID=UPI0020961A47|nr:Hpt domain-containing protein [Oceanicola sp. 502str15]MCO6384634.1 hypothetical protein [Oceanicola sp. 502str15]